MFGNTLRWLAKRDSEPSTQSELRNKTKALKKSQLENELLNRKLTRAVLHSKLRKSKVLQLPSRWIF